MKILKLLLIVVGAIIISCTSQSNDSKATKEGAQTTKVDSSAIEKETPFGLSSDVIQKINNEMGLGTFLKWQNDADPGDTPSYFTTLEYEIRPKKESVLNSNNVIELSIGSKGKTGKYVEYLDMDVLFMNPDEKTAAKKLFLQIIDQLEKVLTIEIPIEIKEALKKEQNLKINSKDYGFEVELYGAAKKAIALHIK